MLNRARIFYTLKDAALSLRLCLFLWERKQGRMRALFAEFGAHRTTAVTRHSHSCRLDVAE